MCEVGQETVSIVTGVGCVGWLEGDKQVHTNCGLVKSIVSVWFV